mgnify:CR=1 FL=1
MEELYAGLFRAMNRFGKLRIGDLVFRYDKKRRHDALGNFTAESGKRRRKSHGVRIGGEASYQEFCCVKDFEESGGSWVDLQNDRSERPAQYMCRSDGEWGGHAAKYDMHHAGIWQGSHFADG